MGRALGVSDSTADIDGGTIRGVTVTSPTISGGTINNAVIGGTTAAAGTFSAVTVTGNAAIGSASTVTIGFFGAAGSTQRPASAMAAVATTVGINSSISSSCFGFTSAQCVAIIALVNELRAAAVALGLIAT